MRVLLVSHSSALYGAQRSLFDLAAGLKELSIDVVCSVPEPGPLREILVDSGFDVRILPCRNWVHSRTAYHWYRKYFIAGIQARKAASWASKENFDLIHTNSIVTPVGAMVAKTLKLPHIWHVREGMPPKRDFFFLSFEKVSKFIRETTRFMVGISEHSCNGMRSFCSADRIRLVYNGPISEKESGDVAYRREGLGKPARLLCVGRVSRAKGHDVAAKALTTLLSRGVDAELSIAGDASPDIRREMESLAPVGLKFLGFVEDTDELYRAHDVLLMSSQKEAFGRVTVEAMARGCVVVGTNSGGTPELITHGETGLLFDPSDASALADQVQSLCKDPSLVRRLRDEAHQRAFARFTRERYARDVAELYREAVSGA